MKKICLYLVLALPLLFAALPGFAQYTPTTITAIQDGSGGFTPSIQTDDPAVGAALEVTGIVSGIGAGGGAIYVQQDSAAAIYNGIRVYPGGSSNPQQADLSMFQVGDSVTVKGYFQEYYTESELHLGVVGATVELNSTGGSVTPLIIVGSQLPANDAENSLPAEQYEGVLLRINNVEITNINGYNEAEGLANGTVIVIDNDFMSISGLLEVGKTYNIIGFGRYNFSQYKIAPRTAADIVSLAGDSVAPELTQATFVDLTTVEAVFSEVMGATGLTAAANYSIDGGIGNPSLVTVDSGGDSVTLTVPTLSLNQTYTLTVSNVVDLAGNVIAATGNTATFSTLVPQVTINEVMYDSIAAGLENPDIEWVELHNTTTSPIDIGGWTLTDGEGDLVLPAGTIIGSTGYLVVSATDVVGIPGAVVVVSSNFILGNSGDGLALFDASLALIDGSTEVFYPDLATSNAGNSIEKINEDFPYTGAASAWREAIVPALTNPAQYRFASPGRMNNTTPAQTGLNHWVDYR